MKETIINVIKEAGNIAVRHFFQLDESKIRKKGPKDIVTEADVEVEKFIRQELKKPFPEFGFLGEELDEIKGKRGRWLVDPIDGTHSFSRGQYHWSISIALEMDRRIEHGAVYAPLLNDLYYAEKGQGASKNERDIRVSSIDKLEESMVCTGFACLRANLPGNNLERFNRIAAATMGQRRLGSAAIELCMVADGQLDAFWEQHLNLYDVAAGSLIAREAGATICDFSGHPGLNLEEVMVTNGKILKELLKLM